MFSSDNELDIVQIPRGRKGPKLYVLLITTVTTTVIFFVTAATFVMQNTFLNVTLRRELFENIFGLSHICVVVVCTDFKEDK